MFSNVGWGEILLVFIVGLILIGPERLPRIIQDLRLLIEGFRQIIEDARENLDGDFREEFEEFRKPLGELNDLRKLNPKTAIARTLFDNDDTYLDLLSGKPLSGGGDAGASAVTESSAQSRARESADLVTRGQEAARARRESAGSGHPGSGTDRPRAAGWVDDDVL